MVKNPQALVTVGWREYAILPELGIKQIKTKIDTGAYSSSLHAIHIEPFHENNCAMVRFRVHPHQRDIHDTITAEAPLLEYRKIKSSNGHYQMRPVIQTLIQIGSHQWRIDLNLTNRSLMGYRLLLGRQALRNRFLVDVNQSFLQSFLIMKNSL